MVRPERNKRHHLSQVLSRNEVERDYAYNRALFVRVAQGWYQFDAGLAVQRTRSDDANWVPIYQALNLRFIGEFALDFAYDRIDEYLERAGLPERTIPIIAERVIARHEAAQREQERREAEYRAQIERQAKQHSTASRISGEPPKWGTPEARRLEIERIRKEIENRRKR